MTQQEAINQAISDFEAIGIISRQLCEAFPSEVFRHLVDKCGCKVDKFDSLVVDDYDEFSNTLKYLEAVKNGSFVENKVFIPDIPVDSSVPVKKIIRKMVLE